VEEGRLVQLFRHAGAARRFQQEAEDVVGSMRPPASRSRRMEAE
jgi:hypothetical protein